MNSSYILTTQTLYCAQNPQTEDEIKHTNTVTYGNVVRDHM